MLGSCAVHNAFLRRSCKVVGTEAPSTATHLPGPQCCSVFEIKEPSLFAPDGCFPTAHYHPPTTHTNSALNALPAISHTDDYVCQEISVDTPHGPIAAIMSLHSHTPILHTGDYICQKISIENNYSNTTM